MKSISEAVDSIFAELSESRKPHPEKRIIIRVQLDEALSESENRISTIIPSKNGSSRILGYDAKQNNGALQKA